MGMGRAELARTTIHTTPTETTMQHTTKTTSLRALAALPAAAALALAGCASMAQEPTATASATASSANAADEMFVTMMIPHHRQAIEMSDLILAKDGIDQRVRDLAQQIRDAQAPEIDTMQRWLDDWGVDGGGMAGMDHGGGMMSDQDMAALEAAEGAAASRLFLEQMIVHHEGAISMAQTEVDEGRAPDVVALAQAIIDAQRAEIDAMQLLLAELP